MSYDVHFERTVTVGDSDLGYTYNCGAMFSHAIGAGGLYSLDKMRGEDALPLLERAVKHMADPANQKFYTDMNPPNGWGDHESATVFLTKIRDNCRAHPDCIVRIT